jgi:hypothetical protein
VGHVFNLSSATDLDLYAKYFWSHQQGKNVQIGPDPVSFEDVDSHRFRAGARISHGLTDTVKPYFGAAYEVEADGKARASSHGLAFDVPELKGATGLGELGVTVAAGEAVKVDVGLQGYIGGRRGVSGSVVFNCEF